MKLEDAERRYNVALVAYRRAQERMARAKRDVEAEEAGMKDYQLATRNRVMRRAIAARCQKAKGPITPHDLAMELGCKTTLVDSVIGYRLRKYTLGPPTFGDWASLQGWSRAAMDVYRWPEDRPVFHVLGLPVEAFREELLGKMAALSRHERWGAMVTFTP